MKKTFLGMACLSVLFGACSNEDVSENVSDVETITLSDFVDWSDFEEVPECFTLHIYPKDGSQPSTLFFTSSEYNKSFTVPANGYDVIGIACDENGIEGFEMDFSTFEGAYLKCVDNTVLADMFTATRAYNAQSTLRPKGGIKGMSYHDNSGDTRAYNATSTLKPIKPIKTGSTSSSGDTRAYSAGGTLKPTTTIKTVTLFVTINGQNNAENIEEFNAEVTNLSAGITLADSKPLNETIDQQLPMETWYVADTEDENLTLVTSFGTFGQAVQEEEGTRAYSATGRLTPSTSIIRFQIANGVNKEVEFDVTEQLASQLEEGKSEIILNLDIEL